MNIAKRDVSKASTERMVGRPGPQPKGTEQRRRGRKDEVDDLETSVCGH